MNTYKTILYFFLSALILTSCEEVIELDLEDAETRLIIEAILDMDNQTCIVDFTQTNGFYESNNPTKIANATMTLQKEDGTNYELSETDTGQYIAENIDVNSEDIFTITVADESGETYTATTEAPAPAQLNALEIEEFTFGFGGANTTNYQVFALWDDDENANNYYRLKSYENDTLLSGDYNLFTDEFSNGEEQRISIRAFFEQGDIIEIELISMDSKTYNYFIQLSTIQSQGFNSSIPFNPQGNFDKDILGYFGITQTSIQTITIE